MSPQHQRAEKRYETRMGQAAKAGKIKDFENEIKRWDRMEARAEKRAAKKYDKLTAKDF